MAMAGSDTSTLHATPPRTVPARANYHVPHCSVLAKVDVRTCRLLTTGTGTLCFRCTRRGREAAFLGYFYAAWLHGARPYCLFESSSLTRGGASQIATYGQKLLELFLCSACSSPS